MLVYLLMSDKIFTFWEGKMPDYIKLCIDTWRFPFVLLTYDNLHNYTDFDIESVKRFTMPQIADCVRVHALRDNGGYWLDADTISISGRFPKEAILGYPERRTNTIGFLHTQKDSDMFVKWASYQDSIISMKDSMRSWYILGNAFTDGYLKEHKEIDIGLVENCWPETYMVNGSLTRSQKYGAFYFDCDYHLSDIRHTDILMLHNSWTPGWYKALNEKEVLETKCTLSNILKEVL